MKAAPAGVVGNIGPRSTSAATLVGCGRELQGDRSTEGVPHQVGAIHPEVVEEPDTVLGLHGNGGRPCLHRAGAPAETPPVVADALEALERRFRHQRLQGVGDVGAVDEQHRLTRPHDLIFQFDTVDLGVVHDDPRPGWPTPAVAPTSVS